MESPLSLRAFVSDFVTFWVVVDPFAVLPVFLALTARYPAAERRRIALEAILVAAVVVGFFIGFGQLIIEAIGLSIRAFQIAGGVVLFLFAVTLVLGDDGGASTKDTAGKRGFELAVYPLAIPAISGPGTMLAAMLLTDNRRFAVMDQIQTGISAAVVLAITLGMLLAAGPIMRVIGLGGANVLRRIMGMILAALAVNTVLGGLSDWLGLPRL